jgi:type IV secretion system protein TrbI
MAGKSDKKLSIHGKKPGVYELNKKLIAIVGSILGIAIVLAFLFSINSGASDNHGQSTIKANETNEKVANSGVLELPKSYNDSSKIDRLLGLNKPVKVVNQSNPGIEKQIRIMREQQTRLQNELARVKSANREKLSRHSPSTDISPMDRQAMSASIFFPGGAPRPGPIDHSKSAINTKGKEKTVESEKQRFMDGKVDEEITNQHTMQKPISKYTIFSGTSIPGILKTTLKSDNPGSIVAIVSQDVYDSVTGQYLIIPKGSTLLGTYNSKVAYGDTRLQAKFIRLIRPDGTSVILSNQAGVDGRGISGFSDEVDNHWGQLIGAAALTTVFNVPAVAAQYSQNQAQAYNPSTGTYSNPGIGTTFGNAALQSAGEGVSKVGNKVTERAMNIQPTITIHDGYRFSVLVTKDIVLPPYKRKEGA